MSGSRWWIRISGISSQAISCPARSVPAHREDSEHRQHSGDLKPGEIQAREWNVADGTLHWGFPSLLLPSPQQGPFQMAKREKIALGPAARKADHSQREMDPVGGSCSSSTNPTGTGLPGGAAHSPTPPLGSRDPEQGPEHESERPGMEFLVFAKSSVSCCLPRARIGQTPVGPRPGQVSPAAVWWLGSPVGSSSPAPRSPGNGGSSGSPAHSAWERCLWKALSRNVASFSQSSWNPDMPTAPFAGLSHTAPASHSPSSEPLLCPPAPVLGQGTGH